MKLWFDNPVLLIVLLLVVILIALILIALAVYLVSRSRKEEQEGEEPAEKPQLLPQWMLGASAPGMRESFRGFLRSFRLRLPGWAARDQVPWFLLVGEQGSGKSSVADALSESASVLGNEADASGYAPRWLLFDEAVLIDLPGRSFLGGEDPVAEKAAPSRMKRFFGARAESAEDTWRSFLRLAARSRPRQPLHGIVLTVPASELLRSGDAEHLPAILRNTELAHRLDDVQHLLGLSLPVYVLVTKCDEVEGFGSFSRGLLTAALAKHGAAEDVADDILGWSNPYSLESAFTSEWVDEAFDSTVEALLRHQLEMLAESSTASDADGVILFPAELRRLQAPLRALIERTFRPTAYHSSHRLRGIYFCGREDAALSHSETNLNSTASQPRLLYVRNLFQQKIFAERFLAFAERRGFFSTNRSVLAAKILSCALALLFLMITLHAWRRIGNLQTDRIQPVLQSLSTSLESVAVSAQEDPTSAAEVINALGAVHEPEYYAVAMPVSYLDVDGLHRNLNEVLERSFGVVILRSSRFMLEAKIHDLVNSIPAVARNGVLDPTAYPAGDSWSSAASYGELDHYLDAITALDANIQRYQQISGAGSGSFTQLNELLRYLHGPSFPDISRYSHDQAYMRLLFDASWQPLELPPGLNAEIAAGAHARITQFYSRWLDENPLLTEVTGLAGTGGLGALSTAGANLSNEQLRSVVSRVHALDTQLRAGGYDWLDMDFNRQLYPALGSKLDAMPFADSTFIGAVNREGVARLSALRAGLSTTPAVLDFEQGRVQVAGPVLALGSVLDALLGYDFMADNYASATGDGGCQLIPPGNIWNQDKLTQAVQLHALRNTARDEVLQALPGEYQASVQSLADRRAANAIWAQVSDAASANPAAGDRQEALETELKNFSQSLDPLKQIGDSLTALRASSEASCLNRSLVRQASSMLIRINAQLPALYAHAAPVIGAGNQPVSQWLYGVGSSDDLASYLEAERQNIETLAAQAAPLVQWLRASGAHSAALNRWRNIAQDVDALKAQKPGNPIQLLESFITTDLDKITPEAGCRSIGSGRSADVFLSVRTQLAAIVVAHCHDVAIARYNNLAAGFNQTLAGRFPFSALLDTRSGAEADPADVARFYQAVDSDAPGLAAVLPAVVRNPDEVESFLAAIAAVRPLVVAPSKDLTPELGVSVQFRTNRGVETYGDRIAEWRLQVGQQVSAAPPNDGALLAWHLGDPVNLELRYANNSPQSPSTVNPSPAASVQGLTVSYRYADPWSLLALLADHRATTPAASRDQYVAVIPNQPEAGGRATMKTVVYFQVDLLPPGAKPGGATLPVPVFPFRAPLTALKSTPASGD
ncbi:type VI secretion protein IcmF/TssM N-terminal domain-containing protein [Silvibacterium sp.]|uniref:type VI secretion protein IcmF/TssM N-terminal domain-containing protein n=1 Tax=Silvibacterium sp. TaxID=1964179 RepID=UPI0039E3783D